jgi:3-oxoadipate enol-lactonase
MTRLHFLDPFPDDSPPVLLLHGLGANGSSWNLQFEALHQAGIRPIAPDVPGFGESKYAGRGWTIKNVAGSMADLISDLQAGPVHLVGLSMGGVIAQQIALDYPDCLRKLVLVSTFSVLQPSNFSQWIYFFQRALVVYTMGLKFQSKIVARRVFPASGQESLREMAEKQIASADPRAYRAAMLSLGLFNSSQRLSEIKVPTLVISGANDTTVAPFRQKVLADGIQGARQIIIPGAGHALAIDQAETFNEALVGFLQG